MRQHGPLFVGSIPQVTLAAASTTPLTSHIHIRPTSSHAVQLASAHRLFSRPSCLLQSAWTLFNIRPLWRHTSAKVAGWDGLPAEDRGTCGRAGSWYKAGCAAVESHVSRTRTPPISHVLLLTSAVLYLLSPIRSHHLVELLALPCMSWRADHLLPISLSTACQVK